MLDVRDVSKTFRGRRGSEPVTALDNVSLSIPDGGVVGLVGESGSGKSTLLRVIMRLESADSGAVELDGSNLLELPERELRGVRRRIQMVFQNPMGSLSPRRTVGKIIEEGMTTHGLYPDRADREHRIGELLELVQLDRDVAHRYPASFSGGQRQRIAIARALAVDPEILICDEAVSALDVSVQAQVLNLLKDMHDQLGLSILFVAHDLAVVRYLCPEIYVLQRGRIVEHGDRDRIFRNPAHPYTRELLDAVPVLDPDADWLAS